MLKNRFLELRKKHGTILTVLLWLPMIAYILPTAYAFIKNIGKALFSGEFLSGLFTPVPVDKAAGIVSFASFVAFAGSMVFLYALLPLMMSDRKTKAERRAFAIPLAALVLFNLWNAFFLLCQIGAYIGTYGATVARIGALAGCALLALSNVWLFIVYANVKNSMFKIILSVIVTTLCYWLYGVILKYNLPSDILGCTGIAIFAVWVLTALDIQFEGIGYKFTCKFLRFGDK